jgi:hypothetical protein
MAFMLNSADSRNLDEERIFFSDLSPEAQAKALQKKGISCPEEANWDVAPLVYYYEPKCNLSQQEIDDNGLAFV